jgi:hypothetical protein
MGCRYREAAHLISETPTLAQLRGQKIPRVLVSSLASKAAPIATGVACPPHNGNTWQLSAGDWLQASHTLPLPMLGCLGVAPS